MNTRFAVLAIAFCLTASSSGLAQSSDPGKSGNPRIAECIRKLGSSSFAQRESARKELEAIGIPALEALRRASKSSDVETSRRIAELIRRFEEQLLTQQILAAKEIHLKLTDATLDQTLAELTKLSGYIIQFQGDRIALANKTFSLDTGKTTFWQALDQFCDQAGLLEKIDLPATSAPMTFGGKARFNRVLMNNTPQPSASPIVLTPRGKDKPLTSYAGAVKSQLRVSRDAKTKDVSLDFIISAEPRLLNGSLVSRPVIEKAIDQEQRKLSSILEEKNVESSSANDGVAQPAGVSLRSNGAFVLQRHARIYLKDGEQAARQLKELAGKLTMQLDLPNETVARIDKILQAAGQSAAGVNGGTLKVNAIRKIGHDFEVQVSMENLTPNPFGANVMINGGNVVIRGNVMIQNMVIFPGGVRMNGGVSNGKDLPDLVDAKGQKYQIANITSDGFHINNGATSRSATIIYRPNSGQAAPSEMVLFGMRTHTIAVPFRFQNVPLP